MNFHQSFKKCGILTPDIKKQPQTSLESISKPTEGLAVVSYVHVHKPNDKILRGIPKMFIFCNVLNIYIFLNMIFSIY